MDDASPRERIREAAMRQFAMHGFKGATVRGIAHEAGVSPGLVQHHFPAKRALQEECDAYVFAVLRDAQTRGTGPGASTDAAFVADTHRALAPVVPYLAMVLVSDAPSAARLFDGLAEFNRTSLTSGALGPPLPEGEDVQAIVAVHTAMQLGLTILASYVYRRLGTGDHDPRAAARIARAQLFLATERWIDEDLEARVRQGLADFEKATGET